MPLTIERNETEEHPLCYSITRDYNKGSHKEDGCSDLLAQRGKPKVPKRIRAARNEIGRTSLRG